VLKIEVVVLTLFVQKYPTKDYTSLEDLFHKLFQEIPVEVTICTLAIAGANVDRKVKVTNIAHWPVSFHQFCYA